MSRQDLRSKAEEKLPKRTLINESLEKLSIKEVNLIVHDLEVHQIELEMQNEELKRIYAELEEAKARYFDIYDLAPEGYLIVSEKGLVLESNLTAANMLGLTRTNIRKQRLSHYIHSEDQDLYYIHRKRLFDSFSSQECELRMIKADGTPFWGHMKANTVTTEGVSTCRLILSDITERKKAEITLSESEVKWKTLFSILPVGISILNEQGKLVEFNQALSTILKMDEEGLAEGKYEKRKYFHADGSPMHATEFPSALAAKERRTIRNVEIGVQNEEDEIIWTKVSAAPMSFSGTSCVITTTDITEQKLVGEALRESEETFNQLMTYSPVQIFIKDENCRIQKLSNSVGDFLKTPAHELPGKKTYELLPPETAKHAMAEDLIVLKEGKIIKGEERINDRTYITIKFPIIRGAGKPNYLGGFIIDVTEQKLAEEKLKKSEERFKEVLENSLDVSYKRNLLTEAYDYLSPRYEDISGYTPSEMNSLHAETLSNLIHPDDLPEIERVLAGPSIDTIKMAYSMEYRFKHKQGHYRWYHDQFVVMRDDCGQNVARIGSLRDITEKKQLIDHLNKANILKDEFLTIITHELKTPIAVINSAIQAMELVCKDELSDKSRAFIDKIKRNSGRQLKLVNNLLDYTLMKGGYLKLHKIHTDIVLLCRSITESILVYAEQKCIQVSFSSTMDRKIIEIDNEKFERILLNLLSNAIKFTPKGKSITVKTSQKTVEGECKICIQVQDQGIGIADDKRELIFERFGQVDSSLARQVEGTGIGLSLSKMLVELLGGEILLESKEGVGSTFTILLPITQVIEHSNGDMIPEIGDRGLIQVAAMEFSDINMKKQ